MDGRVRGGQLYAVDDEKERRVKAEARLTRSFRAFVGEVGWFLTRIRICLGDQKKHFVLKYVHFFILRLVQTDTAIARSAHPSPLCVKRKTSKLDEGWKGITDFQQVPCHYSSVNASSHVRGLPPDRSVGLTVRSAHPHPFLHPKHERAHVRRRNTSLQLR